MSKKSLEMRSPNESSSLLLQIKEYEKLDSEEERLSRSRHIYDTYIMKELLSCSHVCIPHIPHLQNNCCCIQKVQLRLLLKQLLLQILVVLWISVRSPQDGVGLNSACFLLFLQWWGVKISGACQFLLNMVRKGNIWRFIWFILL